MKALVTGDRGFIGRHFVDHLKERDWEVYGFDVLNGRDEDVIPFFMEDTDSTFDLVVHCAYEVGGRVHIDGTNMALANNVLLDSSMFRWALNGGARAVIYYSSSAAYPEHWQRRFCSIHDHGPIRLHEDLIDHSDLEMPDSDYGWAKLTGERIALKAQSLGLQVHILRPFSGYGSDQGLEYPFPSIVKRAIEGSLQVWGPPGQTRDWIHVDDIIGASMAIYEANEQEPVNLCTGIGTRMGELMILARRAQGLDVPEIEYLEDMPTGVYYRVGDPVRMFQYYRPKVSIQEGIHRAIQGR